jgi:NAD(P)H-dependent FMN reductase
VTSKLELKIIVGSTREGRQADHVLPWVAARASAHGAFAVDVLDLRDYPLPMFGEARPGAPDAASVVGEWNRVVGEGDVFLLITPEYNHSVSGVLKNAVDYLTAGRGFRNKVGGFVGYSGGKVGGARAVEHLAHIVIEAEMVPLRNSVLVAGVRGAFADGEPTDPGMDPALQILLDDLAWWGEALRRARSEGQLPPARER